MSRRCDEAASGHLAQVERGGSEGHAPTALHGVPSCGNQDDTSHVCARCSWCDAPGSVHDGPDERRQVADTAVAANVRASDDRRRARTTAVERNGVRPE